MTASLEKQPNLDQWLAITGDGRIDQQGMGCQIRLDCRLNAFLGDISGMG
mgnify:CR=1 FL=1